MNPPITALLLSLIAFFSTALGGTLGYWLAIEENLAKDKYIDIVLNQTNEIEERGKLSISSSYNRFWYNVTLHEITTSRDAEKAIIDMRELLRSDIDKQYEEVQLLCAGFIDPVLGDRCNDSLLRGKEILENNF